MGPTEILSFQHFKLAEKIFKNTNFNIKFLSGKTELNKRKSILKDLANGKIDLIIKARAISKNIKFKNLGYVVIDEQHKFGVKQRSDFTRKVEITAIFFLCQQLQFLEL